jgi:methylmalonyl-CoA carboxyltransferase large subunit
MEAATLTDLESLILELKEQVRALTERLASVEAAVAPPGAVAAPAPVSTAEPALAPAATPAAPEPTPAETIGEEELTVIAAAIAAYLGVRAHIRQIRLVSSSAWAQEGRVSIQASHRLH